MNTTKPKPTVIERMSPYMLPDNLGTWYFQYVKLDQQKSLDHLRGIITFADLSNLISHLESCGELGQRLELSDDCGISILGTRKQVRFTCPMDWPLSRNDMESDIRDCATNPNHYSDKILICVGTGDFFYQYRAFLPKDSKDEDLHIWTETEKNIIDAAILKTFYKTHGITRHV